MIPKGAVVLDVGCGCGILGIIAAKLGAKRVYSVDVNPHAILDTRFNAVRNKVTRTIRPLRSDFTRIRKLLAGKINVVVCNPPQTPLKYQRQGQDRWLSIAQDGGVSGDTFLNSLISDSPQLFPKETDSIRRLELVMTSLVKIQDKIHHLEVNGFSPSIVASTVFPVTRRTNVRGSDGPETRERRYERAVVIHATYVGRG